MSWFSGKIGKLGVAALAIAGVAACGGQETGGEPEAVGGPLMVRRLTETQYRATVGDIFGEDVKIAARFERGLRAEGLVAVGTGEAGMSPFSIEQYDAAAQSVAAEVLGEARRAEFVPCAPDPEAAFDEACVAEFVGTFGPRLFRRPMTADETARVVTTARRGHEVLGDFYSGLEMALIGMMMSPDFLLRIEHTVPGEGDVVELDAYSKASRLSFFLTNAGPDEELLRAAGAGELDTDDGLRAQVDRLIAAPQFERAVRAFFADMLEFDDFADLAKDPEIYPAFNTVVAADAQEQTLRTIVHHLMEKDGDYRDLFTTRETFLTRPLGIVYRVPVPTRYGWEQTEFPATSGRAGIQTHASFLALHAHPGSSSPTLRGYAIRDVFLCQEVPDPPANVNFSVVQNPSKTHMPTARDRLEAHRNEPACAGCHKVMDPPGLALENFDGLGTFRAEENETLIDVSGDLDGTAFATSAEFAQSLRDHPETPRCLVEKMYRAAIGRDTTWDERPYMDYLIASFEDAGYRVPDLMRTIALSENFFAISVSHEDSAGIVAGASHSQTGEES